MRYKREKSKCERCPLRDRNRVWGEGWEDAKLMVIGEAPGRDEDIQGHPFVGQSGKFFNFGLYQAGIMRSKIWITNIISCRPPENNIHCSEAIDAKANCSYGFWDEIKAAKARGATTALLMGRTALEAFSIEGKLNEIRGSVYHSHGLTLIPTYHPAYLLRMGYGKEGSKVDLSSVWMADLKKAVDISRNGWNPPKELFNYHPTIADINALADEKERDGTPLALDIETVGGRNNEYNQVVCIGFGADSERALVVPLLLKGHISYWKNGHYAQMVKAVNRLLQRPLILQNALYDIPILRGNGFNASMNNVAHDVMLMHHCLSGDTEIDTLDFGSVPIKDLVGKSGFWLISYDIEKEKLVPAKVKSVWSEERKRGDLVRVSFWSKQREDKRKMWIDCTSDHRIPTHNRGWVEAGSLLPGDRLVRGKRNKNMVNGIWVHRWVYESLFEPLDGHQIHHIDGNHMNNNPYNLKKVTVVEHNKYHKESQYKATMQMVRNAREKEKQEIDINKAYHLYFNVGLSFREVGKELEIEPTRIRNIFKRNGWRSRNRSEATTLRWEKERNCRVISVTPLRGEHTVYDMTVEKTHTLSANGVVVSNCINPDLPHNLGFIVSVYGETPYWKATLRDTDGDVLDLEDEDRHIYNARDCVVLHQVLEPLKQDLAESKTDWIYYNQSLPLLGPVDEMMDGGITLDKERLDKLKKQTLKEKKSREKDLRIIGDLKPGFSLDSPDDLRWLFFSESPSKFDSLKHLKDYEEKIQIRLKCSECGSTRWYWDEGVITCGKCNAPRDALNMVDAREKSRKSKETAGYKKLLAIKDVKETTPLYLPSVFNARLTDGGKKCVNLDGLLSLRLAAQNRLSQVKKLKNPKPDEEAEILRLLKFLEVYTEYAHVEKLRSTYTSYTVHGDGRVHTSFLIHGTGTGRLASRQPNLQNLPKKRKDFREPFIAAPGHKLVARDYTNLEVFILAYLIEDQPLIDFLNNGGNIHDMNTKDLFHVEPSDAIWPLARRAAKVFQFGGIQYGGGEREIHQKIVQEVPELNLTMAQYKVAFTNWMNAHPEYKAWANEVKRKAREERKSETFMGRVRVLMGGERDIEKQGLNTPIQGGAADIVNIATIKIWRRLRSEGFKAKLLLQIHDELIIEAPDNEVQKISALMKEEMERPVNINGTERRFFTSLSIGQNLGQLEEEKE